MVQDRSNPVCASFSNVGFDESAAIKKVNPPLAPILDYGFRKRFTLDKDGLVTLEKVRVIQYKA